MSKIKISDIQPTGADLFNDSESFMDGLRDDELDTVAGGAFAQSLIVSRTVLTKIVGSLPTTILTKTIGTGGPFSPVIL